MLKRITTKRNYNSRVGIALWNSEIKCIVVTEHGKKLEINNEETYSAKDPCEALNQIKKIALDLPCYLALPHRDVIIKTLYFSGYFKESEIREMLHLNAEQYFSYPQTAIYYDYEFLCELKNKVRVIASKKESVESWRQYFKQAKLTLQSVSADVLALEAYLNYIGVIQSEKVYSVFVCEGTELLQVVIVDSLVSFKNTAYLTAPSALLYLQEIQKFFRLYEASKSFSHPITDVILLTHYEPLLTEVKSNLLLPIIELPCVSNELLTVNFLLAFGMISTC